MSHYDRRHHYACRGDRADRKPLNECRVPCRLYQPTASDRQLARSNSCHRGPAPNTARRQQNIVYTAEEAPRGNTAFVNDVIAETMDFVHRREINRPKSATRAWTCLRVRNLLIPTIGEHGDLAKNRPVNRQAKVKKGMKWRGS